MMEKRYPGLVELKTREGVWVGCYLASVCCVALCVLIALPGPSPIAWKVVAAMLALVDVFLILVLLFPRTYLVVDLSSRTARFVEPENATTIPLADLEPLYIHETDAGPRRGQGRMGRVQWFAVRSAAAPVVFYRGTDREAAEKRLARLTRKFGFSRTAPPKQEFIKA